MTLTLLLDLDGTLLENKMDSFLEGYLGAFRKHVRQVIDPGIFVTELLSATRKMAANHIPNQTLEQAFDAAFYPSIGRSKADLQGIIDSFYQEVFPTLKALTRPKPEAINLVKAAFERDYLVCIATNPLFPLTAIQQRLDWAGLPVSEYPFLLVPSFETFHFPKPNPAFYTELLGVTDQLAGPVVMVGNDPVTDIAAANQAGLATFWLDDGVLEPPPTTEALPRHASLDEFLPWLDSSPPESLIPDFSSPHAIIAVLRGTAAVMDTLSRRTPVDAWLQKPYPDEWSLAEIICHMRDVDIEVNLPRIKKVIKEINPFIPGMDTDPWVAERQYILQDCLAALDNFILARVDLLSLLEGLTPEDWQRPARHAILGPTTIHELAGIIASHDRLHIQQAHHVLQAIS